jgi:hypothetical protein
MGMGGTRKAAVVRAVLAAVVLTAALATGSGPAGSAATQVVDPFGEFTGVTPARILDTRSGAGQPAPGPVGPGSSIDVQVTDRGGVPATGVQAVVLNVTAVTPSASSFLTVWPTGFARPEVSNLNVVPGQTVPNAVTVGLGDGGRVSVFNSSGATHVLFDVVGYYADVDGPAGSRFLSTPPSRLFDTRSGLGGVPAGPVGSGATLTFDVTGRGGIPATGVTGVVMNVTVTAPTGGGFITVYPADVGRPDASSLNFSPGQTVPNLVTVRVPASGVVAFFNANGSTHLLADAVGYYTTGVGSEEGRFVALEPGRILDTRGFPPLAPDEIAGLELGTPPEIGALVTNVTATQPTEAGWLTVYPNDGCFPPDTSTVNFTPGQTVPNMTITRMSTFAGCFAFPVPSTIIFYNPAGFTHVLLDVFGFFTSPSATPAAAAALAEDGTAPSSTRTAPLAEPGELRRIDP